MKLRILSSMAISLFAFSAEIFAETVKLSGASNVEEKFLASSICYELPNFDEKNIYLGPKSDGFYYDYHYKIKSQGRWVIVRGSEMVYQVETPREEIVRKSFEGYSFGSGYDISYISRAVKGFINSLQSLKCVEKK